MNVRTNERINELLNQQASDWIDELTNGRTYGRMN